MYTRAHLVKLAAILLEDGRQRRIVRTKATFQFAPGTQVTSKMLGLPDPTDLSKVNGVLAPENPQGPSPTEPEGYFGRYS